MDRNRKKEIENKSWLKFDVELLNFCRISKTLEPMELETAMSPIPCRATSTDAMVSGTEIQQS